MARNAAKKAAALAALTESGTMSEAAKKAGISRSTMLRYVRDDVEFAEAYRRMRAEMVQGALDSAVARREQAYAVVDAIMNDDEQPGAVRLKAALSIIERADRLEANEPEAARVTNGLFVRLADLINNPVPERGIDSF